MDDPGIIIPGSFQVKKQTTLAVNMYNCTSPAVDLHCTDFHVCAHKRIPRHVCSIDAGLSIKRIVPIDCKSSQRINLKRKQALPFGGGLSFNFTLLFSFFKILMFKLFL